MGGVNLTLVLVGKPRAAFVRAGIEHYAKGISQKAALHLREVKAFPLRKGVSALEARSMEKERILKCFEKREVRVFLDERGRKLDSQQFAQWMGAMVALGRSRLAFVVGGPLGLAPELLEKADLVLSVSPFTLSHDMVVLVLLEQIYRSLAILHNHPYPK